MGSTRRNSVSHSRENVDAHDSKAAILLLRCSNDPIAGSPTMTSLRLLLPLSDEIQATSVVFSNGEPLSNTTSEDFIASFNR